MGYSQTRVGCSQIGMGRGDRGGVQSGEWGTVRRSGEQLGRSEVNSDKSGVQSGRSGVQSRRSGALPVFCLVAHGANTLETRTWNRGKVPVSLSGTQST